VPSKTKANRLSVNDSSKDFIPAACHFDKNTLVTKNGELLQTIQINGINSENINDNLFNLRKVVRESISNTVTKHQYAFWIHTIRRKANLDDPAEYKNYFCENVHELWRQKNHWHDKFVNTLYITIVHDAPELKLKNYSSFVNSLSPRIISKFEENFFNNALKDLTEISESILDGLKEYGARKIGIRFHEDKAYSEMMFLYRRIMQLNEDDCPVPISDISSTLAVHECTIGNDMLEVTSEKTKKFAAIMSIKEYQEVSSESLDKFLQIPVEMVATEIFYFVDKKEVVKAFEGQNYILGVSKDEELKKLKGLDVIFDEKKIQTGEHFCHQQISFMVIGDDLKNLEKQVLQASHALSSIGIMHVREDINLEKTFWAQLPANFAFLSRMKPTTINNTAALSSLHNFPTGNQYSPWGRAITILRSEKGTPYFMNFHDKNARGNTFIFGDKESGKTTLLNFLLSESDKVNPKTIYLSNNDDSEIYIKAREGDWHNEAENIINPFLCKSDKHSFEYVKELLTVLSLHYFDPLQDEDLKTLEIIAQNIIDTPTEERKLDDIFKSLDKSLKLTELKKRFKHLLEGGEYANIFTDENTELDFKETKTHGFNLNFIDEDEYTKKNFPKEKKLVDKFNYSLNVIKSIKMGLVLAFHNSILLDKKNPKILAADNFHKLVELEHYQSLLPSFCKKLHQHNAIAVLSVGNDHLLKMHKNGISNKWTNLADTSFIMPSHLSVQGLEEVLNLDNIQIKKLASLSINSRMFLIKQDNKVIASELSIAALPGVLRILSSNPEDRQMGNELMDEYAGKSIAEWVESLHKQLSQVE